MSYLNLMKNRLKPKAVNDTLEGGSQGSTLHHSVINLTGDGELSYSVTFAHKPLFFAIRGRGLSDEISSTPLIPYGTDYAPFLIGTMSVLGGTISYSQDELTITLATGYDAGYIGNKEGASMVVDYYYN